MCALSPGPCALALCRLPEHSARHRTRPLARERPRQHAARVLLEHDGEIPPAAVDAQIGMSPTHT